MRYVLFTLLLAASTANAENWLPVANLDKKGSVLSVDTASIDRDSEVRKAWFKSVYKADRPIGETYRRVAPHVQSYRWEMNLGHFNCVERTVGISQSILHAADDQVVGNIDIDLSVLKFSSVAPQSIGGLLLQQVCASAASEPRPGAGQAKVKHLVNPDDYYPRGSKSRGERGAPVVNVCVGPSGKPLGEPELAETSGFPELDGAAIRVAKAMRFAPAVQDGAAMPESCIKFKVKFG